MSLGASKPKGLNMITKIGKGYLCLREEKLSLNNKYIVNYRRNIDTSGSVQPLLLHLHQE